MPVALMMARVARGDNEGALDAYEELLAHSYPTCPCECPGLPMGPEQLVAIPAQMTSELTWDGRVVETCAYTVECYEEPLQLGTDVKFVYSPAAPGEYRLSVAYFTAPPDGCSGDDQLGYSCGGVTVFGPAACGADAAGVVEVTLADGDLSAEIMIP